MDLNQFLKSMNSQEKVVFQSEVHKYMHSLSDEANRITMEINTKYHSHDELCELFFKLIGKPLDLSFGLFPPFYTDCGKNITVENNVFINSGCHFQDQGGITINEGALIGHNVTIATLNHGLSVEDRHNLYPKPVVVGKNVWIGSNSTILQGVTIGDGSIVGAGSVVTKDVPPNTVVVGNPARVIKKV